MRMSCNALRVTAFAAAAGALILSGCSSVELDESALVGTTQTTVDTTGQAGSAHGRRGTDNEVYFDFDSYTVRPEYMFVIEKQARALIADPARRVTVEGNTDSRGSREYNLALGQKRSEAVKQRLQLLGVPSSRIEAVSFGREKPRALGEDEESWAENRRADIVNR